LEGRFIPTKDPKRVTIEHTENLQELVTSYKGKKGFDAGEAFDVSYDNITKRLEQGVLSNGVEYGIIEKNNRGETVTISFNLRNGDVKSLTGKGLTPSFTSSMLNKGTENKNRQQIEDELSKLKSSVYFYARNGNLYASINSTKENLMATLALMAEMIKYPKFDEAELEKIKTERLAGIEQNKTEPQYLASKRISSINNDFPKGHPLYAMTIDEEIEAINKVSINDIKTFYNDFYGLGRCSLIAIGSLNSDDVKQFIEKEFNNFKSKYSYSEIKEPHRANKAVKEDIITPDKKNATTLGTLNVEMCETDKDYPAIRIASSILGGGFLNSRLADRLRQKDGVSYGVGASFNVDGDKEDKNSSFFVYAIYAPANYDKVQLGFTEEIDRLIKDGITQEELDNAINGWVQGQTVSRAKDRELSSLINNNIYYHRTLDYQKGFEEKIKKLSVEEINKAIKKYLKPFKEWTVVNAGDFK